MKPNTPLFRMTERAAGGDLTSYLASARAVGDSWDVIAKRLMVDHGLEVTQQTLRVWGRALGVNDEPEQASATERAS